MHKQSFRFGSLMLLVKAALAVVLMVPLAGGVHAESTRKEPPRSSPVGTGWGSKVSPTPDNHAQTLSPEQLRSIEMVNTYFSQIANLAGVFRQTNPDKKVQKGKFYLMRPGRFRFDYARPSRQIIVSDGRYLAIQDLDLNNEDVYGLENTPFRILLRNKVDLLRDARILAVEQSREQVVVTISDKDPDAPGQITIYLRAQPAVELAGWVTRDVQGGVTKVEVSDLTRPDNLDAKLFEREKLFLRSLRQ